MANSTDDQNKKQATNFARYSGIAFQMLATIGVFTFIGYQIDKNRGGTKLIFTAVFGLLAVIVSLYQVVRSLNKTKE